MSEVKVTKTVDVERLFGTVIRNAYHKMAQEAANAAVGRAPVDRGHLKASMISLHGWTGCDIAKAKAKAHGFINILRRAYSLINHSKGFTRQSML